jgi:opacity protein-like surface antigen
MILFATAHGDTTGGINLNKKFGFTVSGYWSSLKNEKLNNEYVDGLRTWDLLDDEIKSGVGFSAGIFYQFSNRFSIEAGLMYLYGSSIKDRLVMDYYIDEMVNVPDYVKTRIYAPSFSIRYHIYGHKISYSFGLSESFMFGKAATKLTSSSPSTGIDQLKNDYSSSGLGFQIFGGVQHNLTGLIAVNVDAGYRHFNCGDLINEKTERPWRYSRSQDYGIINLDYSGPYVSAGLLFRLF